MDTSSEALDDGEPRRPSDWDAPSASPAPPAPLPHHGSSSSSNPAPFIQRGSVIDRLSIGPHCRWDDNVVSEGPQGMEANLSSEGGLTHERMPRYRTCPAFSSGISTLHTDSRFRRPRRAITNPTGMLRHTKTTCTSAQLYFRNHLFIIKNKDDSTQASYHSSPSDAAR